MLVLMMMDAGCWNAELLSWEALAASSPHTLRCHCVCVCMLHSSRGEDAEMSHMPKLREHQTSLIYVGFSEAVD